MSYFIRDNENTKPNDFTCIEKKILAESMYYDYAYWSECIFIIAKDFKIVSWKPADLIEGRQFLDGLGLKCIS